MMFKITLIKMNYAHIVFVVHETELHVILYFHHYTFATTVTVLRVIRLKPNHNFIILFGKGYQILKKRVNWAKQLLHFQFTIFDIRDLWILCCQVEELNHYTISFVITEISQRNRHQDTYRTFRKPIYGTENCQNLKSPENGTN